MKGIFSNLFKLAEKIRNFIKSLKSPPHQNIENSLSESLSEVRHSDSDSKVSPEGEISSDTIEPSPPGDECKSPTPNIEESSENEKPFENTNCTENESKQKTKRTPFGIKGQRRKKRRKQKKEFQQFHTSQPELVCRKNSASGTWKVILSADNACPLKKVYHENTQLEFTSLECHIPSLNGKLTVLCQNDREFDIPLFDGSPLIFKLRNDWAGEGHKISKITRGHFLVFAPVSWRRTGDVPVEPHSCSDSNFRVHYFYRDSTIPNEDIGGFQDFDFSLTDFRIELNGEKVYDDSERGELFVGRTPVLKHSKNIVWARIGEEAENGWKGVNFKPDEQSLSEVMSDREGHFFLRIYDSQVKLIDSTEFRYLRNLKQICINDVDYTRDSLFTPGLNGYPSTEVRFIGADGTKICPTMLNNDSRTQIRSGVLEVQPHPDSDRILCRLEADTKGVEIVIDLQRVWWRLEDDNDDHGEWRDTKLIMSRQEYKEYARRNATMMLLSRRPRSVRVGFDDELDRAYRRKSEEEWIAVPLDNFVDYAQIDSRLKQDAHFSIEWAGKTIPLIQITADPQPEVVSFTAIPSVIFAGQEAILRWTTQNTEQFCVEIDNGVGIVESNGSHSVWPTETTTYTLTLDVFGASEEMGIATVTVDSLSIQNELQTVRVKCSGNGWRSGKGFSLGEIQDAGLNLQEINSRSIRIDRRRRSSHLINIETIRRIHCA